jgi:predicted lipoprotein with Yx(FWY)xxD motif
MRTRSVLRLFSSCFLILLAVGVGMAASAPTNTKATVKTAHSSKYGTLLVSATGFTLYQLGSESKGTIKCTGSCAAIWPPLLLAGGAKPVAGSGVSQARLGTIKRPDHGTQVTYNGKALYRFASDSKPGAVTGQNVAGFHVVVLSVKSAGGTATPATTTAASGGGYG